MVNEKIPSSQSANSPATLVDHEEIENSADPTLEPGLTLENLYMRDAGKAPLLSAEEEKHYARLAQQGDRKARDRMIESNLRMVIKMATRHVNRGLPLMDLIEEGNLGLIHAVEKFDPELGFRFSTYASWWIEQAIERALMNQVRTVRIPVHVLKTIRRYQREAKRLGQTHNTEPRLEEIAKALNEPLEKIQRYLSFQIPETSLNDPLSEDNEDCLADLLPDERNNPAILWEIFDKNITINHQLSQLTDRQQEVLKRRYGLDGYEATTLEEVGQTIGITRERVRQIQQTAIKRLRAIVESESSKEDNCTMAM
ncbi:RNA polymerase sigma factor, sigma-70 family [Nitrosococcus halophilus Nc 4]|uniref:RNA polymerase sigma factor n=1 Tax=Nitrosococcus halophilus (strain Nc4) TaxID=472759 RepID=D5C135_NITHN|nr:sigma-70 family RNA polymerase sigma factor [Nitrosococcus halophilus]ADE14592.1 RNA polymerase sigma factor, sigma-70 family [Nitrosococcus halophilus Nc 4]